MSSEPAIVMRECIAKVGTYGAHFPKGLIMSWPADKKLPPGMVWLREKVYLSGPHDSVIEAWGPITPEALKVMDEVAAL